MSYLETARSVYREAAKTLHPSLCCTMGPRFQLPGLSIPSAMEEMNYGCGTTVHLQDLSPGLDMLYVGVGSGLEALQFAYFSRRPGSVIAVDSVPEMLACARDNFALAELENPWFRSEFVELLEGDALRLPLPDGRVDLAAQNSYRVLDRARYDLERDILLESVELVAVKGPIPGDGPCVFAGETAIYVGEEACFDDGHGHLIRPDVSRCAARPRGSCAGLGRADLIVTEPTWHYAGGGCC